MRPQLLDLEPGERILATAHASFRGAAMVSLKSTFALGSGRMRVRNFHAWDDDALAAGFPPVTPEMVIAVSDRRVLFGKPTFWGGVPSQYSGAIDFANIAQVVWLRHGLITGVAFGFKHGAFVEVEALRGRRLRRVVQVIDEHLTPH